MPTVIKVKIISAEVKINVHLAHLFKHACLSRGVKCTQPYEGGDSLTLFKVSGDPQVINRIRNRYENRYTSLPV